MWPGWSFTSVCEQADVKSAVRFQALALNRLLLLEWRKRYSEELYDMFQELYIINIININKLRGTGHVIWVKEIERSRIILITELDGKRVLQNKVKKNWWSGDGLGDIGLYKL